MRFAVGKGELAAYVTRVAMLLMQDMKLTTMLQDNSDP